MFNTDKFHKYIAYDFLGNKLDLIAVLFSIQKYNIRYTFLKSPLLNLKTKIKFPKMTVLGFLINNFVVLTENKLLDESRPDIFLGLDFHNEYGRSLNKSKRFRFRAQKLYLN